MVIVITIGSVVVDMFQNIFQVWKHFSSNFYSVAIETGENVGYNQNHSMFFESKFRDNFEQNFIFDNPFFRLVVGL